MPLNPLPLLLLALPLAACQAPHHSSPDPDSQLLWQGGDPLTEGWVMAGDGSFVVDGDSLLTVDGMGLLWYSAEDFADFRLELEWKAENQGDNAGVFLRFPEAGTDPWVAVHQGYEVQICDIAEKDIHITGSLYSFQGPNVVASKPAGEWNQYRITVRGQRYTVDLNGVRVNEFIGSRGERGHIGLQNHDPNSKVRFRNIRVTPL
jgi:hypothetical protein